MSTNHDAFEQKICSVTALGKLNLGRQNEDAFGQNFEFPISAASMNR